MLEIAQNFEQMAAGFSPVFLIGLGAAFILVGLFVWLGGLGLRKILITIVGATAGAVCGFFIIRQNIILTTILTAVAAVIARIFEKIFITILTAGLAAALGLAVLAGPYIENTDSLKQWPIYKTQNWTKPASFQQTIEIVKAYTDDFSPAIKDACQKMLPYNWAIIAALGAIFIVAGFFLPRLTSALCCATLGTFLVFAGMISLLLFKAAAPLTGICSRTPFYAAAFIAMILFGTFEQLLLCRRAKQKLIRVKEANKDNHDTEQAKQDWRTV